MLIATGGYQGGDRGGRGGGRGGGSGRDGDWRCPNSRFEILSSDLLFLFCPFFSGGCFVFSVVGTELWICNTPNDSYVSIFDWKIGIII